MKAKILIFLGTIGFGIAWLFYKLPSMVTSLLAEEISEIEMAGVPIEVQESVQIFSQEFINRTKLISIAFVLFGLVLATLSVYFFYKDRLKGQKRG